MKKKAKAMCHTGKRHDGHIYADNASQMSGKAQSCDCYSILIEPLIRLTNGVFLLSSSLWLDVDYFKEHIVRDPS
jgi:hypothetical protein